MRRIVSHALALALALASCLPSFAYDAAVSAGGYDDFSCNAATGGASTCSGLTRSATITAYASGQLVCGATCAPIQIVAGRRSPTSPRSGLLSKVILAKSTGSFANASFNIYLFALPPTFVGLADYSAYTGPYFADLTAPAIYIGQATCAQTTWSTTTDGSGWNVCPLDIAPAVYKSFPPGETIYATIEATGAYIPGAAEKFVIVTYEAQD